MPAEHSAETVNTQRILPYYKELVAHFTGYWPRGYRPRWKRKPWWHLVTTVLSLFGGVAVSTRIIMASPEFWPLLALSWLVTIHGARKAQLVICHHAVHANMTGNTWCDRVLVEILSTILLIQHFEGYFHDHVRTHHGPELATLRDPDMQLLLAIGFRPGMGRDALWRHLYWTIVSPRFHYLFVRMRLRVNYVSAPLYRRLMSGGYTAAVGVCLAITGAWLPWLLAWCMPIFPLYHIASLLQFVSEHRWLQGSQSTAAH
jgi:hypothetical protein